MSNPSSHTLIPKILKILAMFSDKPCGFCLHDEAYGIPVMLYLGNVRSYTRVVVGFVCCFLVLLFVYLVDQLFEHRFLEKSLFWSVNFSIN